MNNQNEIAKVTSFYSGVAKVAGLHEVSQHEVLIDKDGHPEALVVGFDENYVDALFFADNFDINKNLYPSRKKFTIPISDHIIGRTITPLGKSLDGFSQLTGEEHEVFSDAIQSIDRVPVTIPLTTGIKIVDTNLPLGRGQRELIIGDQKLGKSTLAIDTVLNQKTADPPVICVYVLIGQKKRKLENLKKLFDTNNAFLYSTIVAATSASSLAEIYLSAFVGCAIGEYFRDQGKHALIVYDDLSKHAKAYRDIALLTGRAPGREAYPGDIFSLHAHLLERAASLSPEKGGGTLTALPIVETQEGDITAFIPTNLISITDGQIYFERGLFQKGYLPAVNVGLSVSRVGAEAQPEPLQEVTKGLRIALSQHKELQKLAQIETQKSTQAQKNIERGDLLLELLKQDKHTKVTWQEQAVLFYVVEQGYFDDLKKDLWLNFKSLFLDLLANKHFALLDDITKNGLTPENKVKIKKIVNDFREDFVSS